VSTNDDTTIAIWLRFIDESQDITVRVMSRYWSAERFAFGRVVTEFEVAAIRAGLWLPDRRISGRRRLRASRGRRSRRCIGIRVVWRR
jgi:hypothetical protein